ncbi:MAG: hypothetical protein U5K43_08675 [Halofilum sp. (in: g-proteobacteria)]|nr:hypothetical protein [Halofilum sp. (in: g-proteobacteria)]
MTPDDVVWTYAGVRALYDEAESENASAVSRDYELSLDRDGAPVLVRARRQAHDLPRPLAQRGLRAHRRACSANRRRSLDRAARRCRAATSPTADFDAYSSDLRGRYPWLPESLLCRLGARTTARGPSI